MSIVSCFCKKTHRFGGSVHEFCITMKHGIVNSFSEEWMQCWELVALQFLLDHPGQMGSPMGWGPSLQRGEIPASHHQGRQRWQHPDRSLQTPASRHPEGLSQFLQFLSSGHVTSTGVTSAAGTSIFKLMPHLAKRLVIVSGCRVSHANLSHKIASRTVADLASYDAVEASSMVMRRWRRRCFL